MSKDQELEETSEEETEEETSEEEEESEEESEEATPGKQSKEPDITPAEIKELAKAIQKTSELQQGYTVTRQQINKIAENQEAIQSALEKLNKTKDEETGFNEEEEPLTTKKFLQLQKEQAEQKAKEGAKLKDRIDSQLADLRAEGIIKSDDDEKDLLDYAVKHKITELARAASQWQELQEAKKASKKVKDKAKAKVRGEAGKKVGTSKKTGVKSEGVDYEEIRKKDISEIAGE